MKSIVFGLALLTTVAQADCLMRVKTNISRSSINSRPVDIQRLVTPDPAGQRCVLRYRIHIGNDWETVEGEGVGSTETEACVQAIRPERGNILAEVELDKVKSDSQMVCSDLTEIRVRPVQAGEVIWESEVDLHVLAAERPYFTYKSTQCRMFVERGARDTNMYLYQGVICKQDTGPNSKWLVVDKY
jgi:hypothetical protein